MEDGRWREGGLVDPARGLVGDLHEVMPWVDELVETGSADAVAALSEMVQGLSERLRDLAASVGLEHRQAWRLLDLREELGSCELAARLLESGGAKADVVLRMLSRGLRDISAALAADPAAPERRSG